MQTPYDSTVKVAAEKHGNPPSLLWAQLYHESNFNPNARSENKNSVGHVLSVDRGIAQINSVAHPEITDAEAFNPTWSIDWMAETMMTHYKQYGDWTKALIVYNAGHYGPDTAWDNVYANAVIAAEKFCPFQNEPKGDGMPPEDVKGTQWEEAASWAVENGVMFSYSDSTFRPDEPISRGQAAVSLMNLYKKLKG